MIVLKRFWRFLLEFVAAFLRLALRERVDRTWRDYSRKLYPVAYFRLCCVGRASTRVTTVRVTMADDGEQVSFSLYLQITGYIGSFKPL